jgi:predicted RNA binding protein YcfA (HicA-like mRNA interferase family)
MTRKIRDLINDLEKAGFVNRGGKGSHKNFVHPKLKKPITLSGDSNEDAKHYQERVILTAIEEVQK